MQHETGEKNPDSPATTSLAYDMMAPRWAMVDALLGGTETMRAAGVRYLPMHEGESDPAFQERLSVATLFNMTELTLDSWVGRPFSDPVKLSDDMPEDIREFMDDIDLQGNNIDVFARNWFRDGLAKAFSCVLIDSPRPLTEEELGRPRTKADDTAENLRPYWVQIRPENLLFAHSIVLDGREVLTHIRIREVISERRGFSEELTERIKVLDAGVLQEDGTLSTMVTIYEKTEAAKKDPDKDEWEVVDGPFPMGIPFIPLVTFYADREGLMFGKPPLTDLANVNIHHWQGGADQTMSITVARFPILAVSGAVDAARVHIGPHAVLAVPDPTGKWYYVENDGKALAAGREDQRDLALQMAEYGAEFLKKRPGRETATARALDSAEATSPLQDAAVRFIDSMNTALKITNQWLGRDEQPGTAKVATEFGPEEAETADLDALKNARQMPADISRIRYLSELQRRAVLADDFDLEKNEEELNEEMAAFAPPAKAIDEEAGENDGEEE